MQQNTAHQENWTFYYVKRIIEEIPNDVWIELGKAGLSIAASLSKNSDRQDIFELIYKYKLFNPENLAKFAAQAHRERLLNHFDAVYYDSQKELGRFRGRLKTAGDHLAYVSENPHIKRDELAYDRRQVMEFIRELEEDILFHIGQVKKIDSKPLPDVIMNSGSYIERCSREGQLAIEKTKLLQEAYVLCVDIAIAAGDNWSSLTDIYRQIGNSIADGENDYIMAMYSATTVEKQFWQDFQEKWEMTAKNFAEESVVFQIEPVQNEDDFWNEKQSNWHFTRVYQESFFEIRYGMEGLKKIQNIKHAVLGGCARTVAELGPVAVKSIALAYLGPVVGTIAQTHLESSTKSMELSRQHSKAMNTDELEYLSKMANRDNQWVEKIQ
ncbi:MAG: hypothetical protein LUH20_10080 [Lachnospiraceae bacterium]|nr:hypothetical protein [Lachnospiraceae bacterium]